MVFGASDGLPGLIVDSFQNCAIAQINTAGLDQFRDKIQAEIETRLRKESLSFRQSRVSQGRRTA